MKYNINKLPDFYSVRTIEQIDYSFENMERKKCFVFFNNGFTSNVIEPNKRDIRFVWDGLLLFVSPDIEIEDIRNGVDLYNERLVAFQRTKQNISATNPDIRAYVLEKLASMHIPYQIMPDTNLVSGYPSQGDLWSTREEAVLLDATETTGNGPAYYFNNPSFNFRIKFNSSNLPDFEYNHQGALVLKGESSTAVIRFLANDIDLQTKIEKIVGGDKLYSYLEGKELPAKTIDELIKRIA